MWDGGRGRGWWGEQAECARTACGLTGGSPCGCAACAVGRTMDPALLMMMASLSANSPAAPYSAATTS